MHADIYSVYKQTVVERKTPDDLEIAGVAAKEGTFNTYTCGKTDCQGTHKPRELQMLTGESCSGFDSSGAVYSAAVISRHHIRTTELSHVYQACNLCTTGQH